MGCRSDYLERSGAEAERQLVAQLLTYVLNHKGKPVPADVQKAASDYYGAGFDGVAQLCSELNEMAAGDRDTLVYNARDKTARELATWWEAHQEWDRKREQQERDDAEREQLKREALAKLSDAEKRALGIK